MITLLVLTDGRRDCIAHTIPSALRSLAGPITARVIHDDSADPAYRAWLAEEFPTFTIIGGDDRRGFGGAIRHAWAHLRAEPSCVDGRRYVFHIEDDFTFNRPVDLAAMAATLNCNPHLVQLALRRQPWNDEEVAAGGIVEQHPDAYTDVASPVLGEWLEHRLFLTTNPSLYRQSLCSMEWPEGPNSEGRFTHQLLRDGTPEAAGDDVRFGYWGARNSGEWVTHIGSDRVGVGY